MAGLAGDPGATRPVTFPLINYWHSLGGKKPVNMPNLPWAKLPIRAIGGAKPEGRYA
jgi:hypothetical protein